MVQTLVVGEFLPVDTTRLTRGMSVKVDCQGIQFFPLILSRGMPPSRPQAIAVESLTDCKLLSSVNMVHTTHLSIQATITKEKRCIALFFDVTP